MSDNKGKSKKGSSKENGKEIIAEMTRKGTWSATEPEGSKRPKPGPKSEKKNEDDSKQSNK